MKKILPNKKNNKSTNQIYKYQINNKIIFGTTVGLKKNINEDRIGYTKFKDSLRFCLADGHWGSTSAEIIADYWLDENLAFPKSKQEAIEETKKLEKILFEKFGKKNMDENADFTPESSQLFFELSQNKLTIINYGDCRLLITNNQKVKYKMPTKPTWLGAFSYLGLRGRIPVEDAITYKKINLAKGDFILAFTDGIDECIYETPTLSTLQLANITKLDDPNKIIGKAMKLVFKNGAEDNASILVIKNTS